MVDAGEVNASTPNRDQRDRLRDSNPDLGAYESQQGGLEFSLNAETVAETVRPGSVTLTITRARDIASPLDISLSSNVPSQASIPPTVTMAAGSSSVSFPVAINNDTRIDNPMLVHFVGWTREGFEGGTSLTVTDDDGTFIPDGAELDGSLPLSGSPYFVDATATISSGSTLTVEAGATTYFNDSATLRVEKNLDVSGTKLEPVRFESGLDLPEAGDWDGIQFLEGASSTIDWTIVQRATTGISCLDSSPSISNTVVRDNSEDGILIEARSPNCSGGNASPTITHCLIERNAETGFVVFVGTATSARNCIIIGNKVGAHAWMNHENRISHNNISNNTVNFRSGIYDHEAVRHFNHLGSPSDANSNITANPKFIDGDGPDNDPDTVEDNNYHLAGGSPCIDAGFTSSVFSSEPAPNGGRANIGLYGNTPEAMKSNPVKRPTFTSAVPTAAGSITTSFTWDFDSSAEGAEDIYSILGTVPRREDATIDAATGSVSWQPTLADSGQAFVLYLAVTADGETSVTRSEINPGDDADSDGIPDLWEAEHGLDPYFPDAKDDLNGDGIPNLLAFAPGIDPRLSAMDALPEPRFYNGLTNMTLDQNPDASHLIFSPEYSEDMVTWHSPQTNPEMFNIFYQVEPPRMEIQISRAPDLKRYFVRLNVYTTHD